MTNTIKVILVALAIVALGATGYLGASCTTAMYADHQLLNQIRANAAAQQQQQAEQIQQFRQQQQAQVPAAPPAPALVK